MSAQTSQTAGVVDTRRLAIVGNPNTGKTTLFNALTGLRHKVGNYPGVTVERREARCVLSNDNNITVVDLPGAYSLIPTSADELVTRDVLLGFLRAERPIDGVVVVLDASNIERHLYLASQIIDLGFPVVAACNMIDAVKARGQKLDLQALSERLGVPVVGTIGNRRVGVDGLRRAVAALGAGAGQRSELCLPEALEMEVDGLSAAIARQGLGRPGHERALAMLMLASSTVLSTEVGGDIVPPALLEDLEQAMRRLGEAGVRDPAKTIVQCRYEYCRKLLEGVVAYSQQSRHRTSDKIDRIVTHPVLGAFIFAVVMFVMFLAIFSWAEPVMAGIESLLERTGVALAGLIPDGMLQSLVVDGVIGGVGAVVVFLPQICILFFFISLLEDTGYMARAAVVMNRLMNRIGLPGKSFIPLLSSFACAIPGIMATRTIENRLDRFVTILIAPFMGCSARLPVYVILIAAVFGERVWLKAGIMFSMYMLGIVAALGVALLLKRIFFRTPQPGFIIELPPYRRPQVRSILRCMWERSVLFLKDAGSIIFAVSVVLWALAYFPRADEQAVAAGTVSQLEQSYLGRAGHLIAPAIEPLGYDWKIGVGLVASFAAREVFVSTMGIVYGVGDEADETSAPLREKMAADTWPDGRPILSPLSGISLMVFYVFACMCVSTLGVVKRETNSWRWPAFMFVYMTGMAYLASLAVYQVGMAMGWGA